MNREESAPGSPGRRTKYEGMLNVVRFNKPMYLKALAAAVISGVTTVILAATNGPAVITIILGLTAATCIYFIGSSILASHIAYDRSGLYGFGWLSQILHTIGGADNNLDSPFNIVNIHTGLDETTPYLKYICSGVSPRTKNSHITVIDMYDRSRTPEPSITVANKLYPAVYPEDVRVLRCGPEGWQIENESTDLALLFLSAHELRRPGEKDKLFSELARILKPDGNVVLLEHLRDLPNFIAFGPGFLHFFPYSEWRRATLKAGFALIGERKVSPFIHLFRLQRSKKG